MEYLLTFSVLGLSKGKKNFFSGSTLPEKFVAEDCSVCVDLSKREQLKKAIVGAAVVGAGLVGLSSVANADVIFRAGGNCRALCSIVADAQYAFCSSTDAVAYHGDTAGVGGTPSAGVFAQGSSAYACGQRGVFAQGYNACGIGCYGVFAQGQGACAIGKCGVFAQGKGTCAVGCNGVFAVGCDAVAYGSNGSVAIGCNAYSASNGSVAIGCNARAMYNSGIQFGEGCNNSDNSLQVGCGIRIFGCCCDCPINVKNGDIWLNCSGVIMAQCCGSAVCFGGGGGVGGSCGELQYNRCGVAWGTPCLTFCDCSGVCPNWSYLNFCGIIYSNGLDAGYCDISTYYAVCARSGCFCNGLCVCCCGACVGFGCSGCQLCCFNVCSLYGCLCLSDSNSQVSAAYLCGCCGCFSNGLCVCCYGACVGFGSFWSCPLCYFNVYSCCGYLYLADCTSWVIAGSLCACCYVCGGSGCFCNGLCVCCCGACVEFGCISSWSCPLCCFNVYSCGGCVYLGCSTSSVVAGYLCGCCGCFSNGLCVYCCGACVDFGSFWNGPLCCFNVCSLYGCLCLSDSNSQVCAGYLGACCRVSGCCGCFCNGLCVCCCGACVDFGSFWSCPLCCFNVYSCDGCVYLGCSTSSVVAAYLCACYNVCASNGVYAGGGGVTVCGRSGSSGQFTTCEGCTVCFCGGIITCMF